MSSIDKMAIRGIRSFSPFDEEKIEFYKPLTLILGQNGAGKTTIIESLRTMTSGSMPPHTQGGKTFIHDPRLSNLPETKASVKLVFNTIKGKPVFAMRSFQLLNKKQKQEFKKLEQVLKARDERTGQEISINKNCSEMDKSVPLLMGVSNAILENVIFCHQEESLWPFSDQANLKKIFDEIFDTTKYTKALTEMRAVAKKYTKYAKEFKQELDLKKKDYEQYAKLKTSIGQYDSKLQELKHQLQTAQSKKDQLDSDIRDCDRDLQKIQSIENEFNFMQLTVSEKQKQAREMQSRMRVGEGPQSMFEEKERELQKMRETHETTMVRLKDRRSGIEEAMRGLRDQAQQTQVEVNRLRGQMLNNKRVIEETAGTRNRLMHGIRDLSVSYSSLVSSNLLKKQSNLTLEDIRKEIDNLKLSKDSKDSQMNHLRSERYERLSSIQQAIRIEETKDEIYKKTLQDVERQLALLKSSEQRQHADRKEFDDIEKQLTSLQDRLCEISRILQDDFGVTIGPSSQANQGEVHSSLDQSFNDCGAKSNKKGKVYKITQEIEEKQAKLEKTEVKIADLKKRVMEVESMIRSEESLEKDYLKWQDSQEKASALIAEVNSSLQTLKIDQIPAVKKLMKNPIDFKEVMQAVNQRSASSESIKFAIEEMRNIIKKVQSEEGKNEGDPAGMEQITAQLDKYLKDESTLKSTVDTINRLYKLSKSKGSKSEHTCFLCKSTIDDSALHGIEQNFLKKDAATQQKEGKIAQERQKLLKLIESNDLCKNHKQCVVIQEMENRISELQEAATKRGDSSGGHEVTQKILEIEYLVNQMIENPFKGNYKESAIKSLKEELITNRQQQDKLSKEAETLKSGVWKLQESKREADRQAQQLQLEYVQTQAKKYKLMSKSKNCQSQMGVEGGSNASQREEDLMKLTKAKAQQESEIRSIKAAIGKLEGERRTIQDDVQQEKVIETLAKEVRELSEFSEALTRSTMQLQSVEEQLTRYRGSLEVENQEADREIVRLEVLGQRLEKELTMNEQELKQINEAMQAQASIEKTLEEFERLKTIKNEIVDVQGKMLERQKQMAVKSQYLQKREAKSSEMLEAMSVYNKSSGYSISIQDSLRQMKVDLAEEKFTDIEKRLLELEIKYNLTRDMALEIGEKHDALEEALMKYHHEKMKEINKTLSDFWKMTYKGNDIDAIEIKSDVERSATNSRIRSYNYRIVLKTADDTELDMRGRCSAGQKVLSSIIIRLSLAETFCANCGILALDEPTTNLDVDNIEGLANALIEIIESRKRQENFQLIVITHDQQFVQLMGRDYAESYWRVYKDNNTYSRIQKDLVKKLQ